MAAEAAGLLWDALNAAQAIQRFVAGKSFDDYRADAMLSAAVERKLEIVGEALNQLRRLAPDAGARIRALPSAIGMRNVLIHAYASVDHRLVWDVATVHLADLIGDLNSWLHELDRDADAG